MSCKLIRGGFSFCGVDIAELGLSYAPELENTYVYHQAEADVHEETFGGHHGGYFYGVSKKPKEFVLRCYFEDSAIDRGIMEKINHLFRIGKSGKLVFCRRPWCYYYATVTSLPHPDLSNYLNGTITITMKAYYPFARGDDLYYDTITNPTDGYSQKVSHDLVMQNTGLLEYENMVPPTSFVNLNTVKDEPYTFLLHNPGTEFAPVSITAAGDADMGVIIRNKTTHQECRIIAMTPAKTSDLNKSVYIDGINGCTCLIGENTKEPAFFYHDSGFIYLAPAYPVTREIYPDSIQDNIVTLVNTLYNDVTGQYIYLNDWCKIEEMIDPNTIRIDGAASIDNITKTTITRMNEMEIQPVRNMALTHMSFSYKPTYA